MVVIGKAGHLATKNFTSHTIGFKRASRGKECHMYLSKTIRPNFVNFLYVLTVAVTLSSPGVIGIHYVLPVLRMTLCFCVILSTKLRERAFSMAGPST